MEDENPTAFERTATERDAVDALLFDSIEEARRNGYDPDELAQRLDTHRERLSDDGFEAYEP